MSASFGVTWTNERVERLKVLWAEGLSASQIAAQLGGVTRNAIIGKIHRLGLSGRARVQPTTARLARSRPATASPEKNVPKPFERGSGKLKQPHRTSVSGAATALAVSPDTNVEKEKKTAEVIPMARYLTLPELDSNTCRWPIGDPQSPDFRFCGAQTETGQVYCAGCSKKAYMPKQDRRTSQSTLRTTRRQLQF